MPDLLFRCGVCGNDIVDGNCPCGNVTTVRLTHEVLDEAFSAVVKQGSTPRHDCRHDGHVLHFNPGGFAWCIYCHASEAEIERPA